VARVNTHGALLKELQRRLEGELRLEFHLAPPLFAEREPETGHLRKRAYGPWMFRAFTLLATLKVLRGTPFDPFGRTAERRLERRLIADYEAVLRELLAGLTPENHALAVEIAQIPGRIRGFGHVKEKSIAQAKVREASLLAAFRHPAPAASAAE
jgi:indolepyruvate ferredoxin oxidoreductase